MGEPSLVEDRLRHASRSCQIISDQIIDLRRQNPGAADPDRQEVFDSKLDALQQERVEKRILWRRWGDDEGP